jgi:16S rRNA (guanine527-N7)-methyltransferase
MIGSEEQARSWLNDELNVSRETFESLSAFVDFLKAENERQNLVAKATLGQAWNRHIADSAQLLRLVPDETGTWLDLGSGAGFPGLIVAALSTHSVTLVESRRLRVDFLRRGGEILGVEDRVEIIGTPLERVLPRPFRFISARAFAPLDRLLALAHPFSTEKTRWILPKGRSAKSELEAVQSTWQGDFRLEQSLTDADAQIIVAEGVRPKRVGKRA